MPKKRTTSQDEWLAVVADFKRVHADRKISFKVATDEMKLKYHRAFRCLRDSRHRRPHDQRTIDKIVKWCAEHSKNGK